MKKILYVFAFLSLLGPPVFAQSGGVVGNLTADSTDCTKTNACLLLEVLSINGGATIKLSGTFSATVQFEATADPLTVGAASAVWVALSATPSNSSTTATSATAAGVWQVNVAGYQRIRVRVSTYASGTVAAAINLSTASARGGSGGGGGGGGTVASGTAGDTTFYSAATTISPATVILDMTGIAGADLGAKMNNCDAQLPATGGRCMGDNLTGALVLSTPVVTTHATAFTFCGQAISQTANINLAVGSSSVSGCPGVATIFTKGANIDQVSINENNAQINNISLNGNRAGGFTGSGVTVGIVSHTILSNVTINSEAVGLNDGGSDYSTYNELTITDFGVSGATFAASTFQATLNGLFLTDSGDATGPGITIANGTYMVFDSAFVDTSSPQTAILETGLPQHIVFSNSNIQAFGGHPAFELHGIGDRLTNNIIFGGGASGPVVTTSGDYIWIADNVLFAIGGAQDVLTLGSEFQFIHHNLINWAPTSGGFGAIHLTGVGAQSSNSVIDENRILFSQAENPSGDNYGIWLQPPAGSGFKQNHVHDNAATGPAGGVHTHDIGFFFDNSVNNTNAGQNEFRHNTCDLSGSCILRTDTQLQANIYAENSQSGSGAIFGAGGTTNDIVTQTIKGIAFASLPIAGSGSIIYCTDCTQGVPAGSGAGGFLIRNQATWQSMPSPIAPTVASGFGTGAAVVAGGLPSSFRLGVGTSNTGTGVITLPAAKTGWNCTATNVTTKSTTQATVLQKADSTTSATLQNYTDIMGTAVMTDNDVLSVSCFPH